MSNANLALKLFSSQVLAYRNLDLDAKQDELVLKTDNQFYCWGSSFKNRIPTNIDINWIFQFRQMDSVLKGDCFRGNWKYGNKNWDYHIFIADLLSRGDYSEAEGLACLDIPHIDWLYTDYSFVNMSKECDWVLDEIACELECGETD